MVPASPVRNHARMESKLLRALLLAAMTLTSAEAHARTATRAERETCEAKIQPKLDAVDARLRGGYSASEGESLKERRRKLTQQRAACRKVPRKE